MTMPVPVQPTEFRTIEYIAVGGAQTPCKQARFITMWFLHILTL